MARPADGHHVSRVINRSAPRSRPRLVNVPHPIPAPFTHRMRSLVGIAYRNAPAVLAPLARRYAVERAVPRARLSPAHRLASFDGGALHFLRSVSHVHSSGLRVFPPGSRPIIGECQLPERVHDAFQRGGTGTTTSHRKVCCNPRDEHERMDWHSARSNLVQSSR